MFNCQTQTEQGCQLFLGRSLWKNQFTLSSDPAKLDKTLHTFYPNKISYFVDNDADKWDTFVNGMLVCNPSQLLQEDKEYLRIFIASMYFNQIKEQLSSMGFQHQKHYFYITPYYTLLCSTNFVDIVEMQANSLAGQQPANLLDRMKMLFSIQEEVIRLNEGPNILLLTGHGYERWGKAVQQGLKSLFHMEVKRMAVSELENGSLNTIADKYRRAAYSRMVYVGTQDSIAQQLGSNFESYCCTDITFDSSDTKKWIDYLYCLAEKLGMYYEKVSVIVPNYNYARYLPTDACEAL